MHEMNYSDVPLLYFIFMLPSNSNIYYKYNIILMVISLLPNSAKFY